MVGHAIFQTADVSGPSTMDRSYLAATGGWDVIGDGTGPAVAATLVIGLGCSPVGKGNYGLQPQLAGQLQMLVQIAETLNAVATASPAIEPIEDSA